MPCRIEKVVSGGQTGADRAAWDAAREHGIAIGGFVPKGCWAEDGAVPDEYGPLEETGSAGPDERTRKNVENSDKTLILARGDLRGGTALTSRIARQLGKPCLVVDLAALEPLAAAALIVEWLEATPGTVLNVAGPRASEDKKIYGLVKDVLNRVFHGL